MRAESRILVQNFLELLCCDGIDHDVVAGHGLRPLSSVKLAVISRLKVPRGASVEHNLVVTKPAALLEGDHFSPQLLIVILEEAVQMTNSEVQEVKTTHEITSLHNQLTCLVQFALQICHNLLHQERRCKDIGNVVVEEVLEAVRHCAQNLIK